MLGDPDSCGVWAPCLTYDDGLFWLIYTDVKRYGRTSQGGAAGASLRDIHNYLVTSPQHRRRLVGSDLSEQQRLRSLAVPRRRRPQISGQHAAGTTGRAAIVCGHRAAGILARGAQAGGAEPHDFQRHVDRLHRGAASLQAQRLLLPAHRRGRHRLGPRGDDGAVART